MLGGITLCIGKKFSTSRFWDDIRDSDSTAFVYVGETARYLLAAPPSPKDKQHRVKVMFGNGLRPDVWKRFGERFGVQNVSEFFTSTEGVFALMNVCHGKPFHSFHIFFSKTYAILVWEKLKLTETTGPYFANAVGHHGAVLRHKFRDIYVPVEIDIDTNEVLRDPKTGFAKRKSYQEGGEILVNIPSESAFVGYWRNPEATEKKFERNVFKKGDLFYRTGDALRRTSDGRWFFLDRLGDTFRWKSENVSTAEVAECFGNFPGVVEASVYGVEVPGRFLFCLSAPPISFTTHLSFIHPSLINTIISSLVHINHLLFQSIHLLFFYIYLLSVIHTNSLTICRPRRSRGLRRGLHPATPPREL